MFTILFLRAFWIYFFYLFVEFVMQTAKISLSASSTPTIAMQSLTEPSSTTTATPILPSNPTPPATPTLPSKSQSKTAPTRIERTVHGNISNYLNDGYIKNSTYGFQFDIEEEITRAIAYMKTFLKNSGLYDCNVPIKTQIHDLIDIHAYHSLFSVQKQYLTAKYLSMLTWLAMEVTSFACIRSLADAFVSSPSLEVFEFALCILTGVAKNRGLKYDNVTLDTRFTPNQLKYSRHHKIPTANDTSKEDFTTNLIIDICSFRSRLSKLLPFENVNVNEDLTPSKSTESSSSGSSSKRSSTFSTSSGFTAHSVDSTATSHKEPKLSGHVVSTERLSGFNATSATLSTLESTFKNIKSGIATMIDEKIEGQIHSNKYSYLNRMYHSLIEDCKNMEEHVTEFKKKFACAQICLGISLYISDATNLLELLQTNVITAEDLKQIKDMAHNSSHMVNSLLAAYQPSLFQPGEAPLYDDIQVRSRVLQKQYRAIQETYHTTQDMKSLLLEGHISLDMLCLTDQHLHLHYTTVAQDLLDIQEDVYEPVVNDLQLLVNTQHNKTNDKDCLQPYEKIINSMINSVFTSLQTFKADIMGCLVIIQKFERKKEVEEKMKQATQWLIELKAKIVVLSLFNNSKSKKKSQSYQLQLTEYQHMHSAFTLTVYNDICNYFVEFSGEVISSYYRKKNILYDSYEMDGDDDNHLMPEYFLFKSMQNKCEEISRLLSSN